MTVEALKRDALASAAQHAADAAAFMRRERIARMETFVDDLQEWLNRRGDLERLARGRDVRLAGERGAFELSCGGRQMTVRPRDDMAIMVGGHVVRANPDCPVLDRRRYKEVLTLIHRWLDAGPKSQTKA